MDDDYNYIIDAEAVCREIMSTPSDSSLGPHRIIPQTMKLAAVDYFDSLNINNVKIELCAELLQRELSCYTKRATAMTSKTGDLLRSVPFRRELSIKLSI